jgi:hypothetical protein
MSTRTRWIGLLWVALLLVGCSQVNAAGKRAPVPQPLTGATNQVIAEGCVVPARSGHLAFQIPGRVGRDVLVETGQHVAGGKGPRSGSMPCPVASWRAGCTRPLCRGRTIAVTWSTR